MKTYKIRERTRRCASPREGLRNVWDEVQVIEGRSVVARFDLREQAERWISQRGATHLLETGEVRWPDECPRTQGEG